MGESHGALTEPLTKRAAAVDAAAAAASTTARRLAGAIARGLGVLVGARALHERAKEMPRQQQVLLDSLGSKQALA